MPEIVIFKMTRGFYETETKTFYPYESFDFTRSYFGLVPALQDSTGNVYVLVAESYKLFSEVGTKDTI